MKACLVILLVCLVLLTSGFGSAIFGWSSLKPGMTPQEVSAVIGKPILQTQGHGFEIWIYDHQAEVVFHGGLVMGWTAPVQTHPLKLSRL